MSSGLSEVSGNFEALLDYERTVIPSGVIVLSKKMPLPNNLAYVEVGTKRGGSFFGPPEVFHCIEHLTGPAFRGRLSDDAVDATTEVHRMTVAECHARESRLASKFLRIARDLKKPPLSGLQRELNAMIIEWGKHHDSPEAYLESIFLKQCFPKSNVARSPREEHVSLNNSITRAVIRHYWKKFLIPGNLISATITNKMSHQNICEKSEQAFSLLTNGRVPRFRRPTLGKPTASLKQPHIETRGWLKNAYFMVGAPIRHFPPHLEAAAGMMGNMFESYLNHLLRFRRGGLVYRVKFHFISNYMFSYFAISGECAKRNLDHVVAVIEEKFQSFSVGVVELEKAKTKIVEDWVDKFSNPNTYADQIYQAEVNGIDLKRAYAEMKNLSPAGVLRIWQKYFQSKDKVLVILRS